MSPLEKVPFATFYPLQKYLRGTCFFQKRLFQVDSYFEMMQVIIYTSLNIIDIV